MPFRVPEHILVELKKEFLRSNQQFINSNGSFGTQLGLRPSRFQLCSRTNMTKILSTRTWHKTKHPWKLLIFVLCHLRVERIFFMLAWLQSRNLNGQSPSCVPNEPFEFMNCRFDLKNSFFSSTKICSGTRNGIHWEEYSSVRVLTWFYGNVLA